MEILLGISILINAIAIAITLNTRNNNKEQEDDINDMHYRLDKLNTIKSEKEYVYNSKKEWFKNRFPNRDFDALIDIILIEYISNYSYGDTIEYSMNHINDDKYYSYDDELSTDELLDTIAVENSIDDKIEINEEDYAELMNEHQPIETNFKLDEISEDISDFQFEKQDITSPKFETNFDDFIEEPKIPEPSTSRSDSYSSSSYDSGSSDSGDSND